MKSAGQISPPCSEFHDAEIIAVVTSETSCPFDGVACLSST